MPETGTDAKSSLRKYIGFESNSVLACAKGKIAALIIAVIEIPLHSACPGTIRPADTLQQGHSKQRDFRVKHPRLYCPGRNPQNFCSFPDGVSCKWMSSTTLRARGRSPEMADFTIRFRSRREQFSSGSGASSRNSRCATGSDDGFDSSMGTSRDPRFLRSFIKAALIAMRVSQVANWDLPSNVLRWTKAFRKHSCAASSASSRFRMIRRVTQETRFI